MSSLPRGKPQEQMKAQKTECIRKRIQFLRSEILRIDSLYDRGTVITTLIPLLQAYRNEVITELKQLED